MKSPLAALLIVASPVQADQSVDELLGVFQTRLETGGSLTELCDSLEDRDDKLLNALSKELNRVWPSVRDRYLDALGTAGKAGVSGDSSSQRKRVRELRQAFMEVYVLDEVSMKPLLKSKSMPAVEELRKILLPTADELVTAHPDGLAPLHSAASNLAKFRDATLDAALSTTPTDSLTTLEQLEGEVVANSSELPRDGLKILEKNRKIAESNNIPEEEARGIEECNLWRLELGLNALILDPKLCEAARDHSKDMEEQDFFAHESPVKGKHTPWDRASNFGTTASGENIYMGSKSSEEANLGWFYSPGHHKNMFGDSHRRIGLGRHGVHWTQLFGR